MILALVGLVGLQASLLRNALELKEQTFRRNVQAAMAAVARGLEASETITATLQLITDAHRMVIHAEAAVDTSAERSSLDVYSAFDDTASGAKKEMRFLSLGAARAYCDSVGLKALPLPDSLCTPAHDKDSAFIVVRYTADSARLLYGDLRPRSDTGAWRETRDSGRAEFIERVMERLAVGECIPIEKRVQPERLDSLIRRSLDDFGITLEPVYGILTPGDSAVWLASADGYSDRLTSSEFKSGLFPNDLLAAPSYLSLYFPDRTYYLLKQIGPMLAATILFMSVVVGVFGYSLRTIVVQRRTARQMVDFVNNMTHEFKTPISTVALACEAILRPEVITDAPRVRRFSGMIMEENRRMRHQAEKILQMAALEEKQGRLKLTEVDIHDVIASAVDNIALQVEQRGGRITCDLKATRRLMEADEVHLIGVFHNLLDNANKYSPGSPQITVTTEDAGYGIRISVVDHGLGLKPDDRTRIFDKYYRVTHGNVHDVKGFGLGLSYVELMVRTHGGRIWVESELGKGTRMILWFPARQGTHSDHGEVSA
jgi:two-component system phosphate regulon sensor histidine kinase PhoR